MPSPWTASSSILARLAAWLVPLVAGCATNVVYSGAGGAGGATTTTSSSATTSGAGGTTTIPVGTGGTTTTPPLCQGGASCVSASDCPESPSSCVVAACVSGCCETMNAAAGAACATGGGNVCDGTGNCVSCLAASDCPPSGTSCAFSDCTPSHTCNSVDVPAGAPCTENGGVVCNGQGACVNTCGDGVQDGTETDVDCGGGTCPPCLAGMKCAVGSDCKSGHCQAGVCK